MSDIEEVDTKLTEEIKTEIEDIKFDQLILDFMYHLKDYINEKYLDIGDLLESSHLSDFIDFII